MKKISSLNSKLFVFLLIALTFSGYSQSVIRCATMEMDANLKSQFPELESKTDFENWLQNEINSQEGSRVLNGVYYIPVVFHVIHNGEAVGTGSNVSQAAIQSQIDVLNEDFRRLLGSNGYNTHPDGADTQIEFCLAMRRPDGSAFTAGQPGVNRINRSSAGFSTPPFSTTYIDATIKPYTYNGGVPTATRGWSPDKYMNIWLCSISGGILGYAQFPQSPLGGLGCSTTAAATDGVVFQYTSVGKSSVTGFSGSYNEGRTATHEIGHWLGLRHIWGDGDCTVDDYCNDTPLADGSNYGCPTGTNSCTALPDAGVDMIENYMDYTDDLCMNIFTNDQKSRMRTVLTSSPMRLSLINSDACTPPNPNDASVVDVLNPAGDNCPGAITPQVTIKNRGSNNLTSVTVNYKVDNGTVTTYSWTGTLVPSAEVSVSLPSFSSTLGQHTFTSYTTLPNGSIDPSAAYDTTSVSFAVSNGITAPYVQDFDSGVFPPDLKWTVVNSNNDCYEWIGGAATSSAGVLNNSAALFPGYGNSSGGTENLVTPIFLLPCNATTANIQFDVAYRRRNTNTSNYDRLYIELSENCGATWNSTLIYDKTGTALQQLTTTTGNVYYTPVGSTDWRTETVNLLPYVTGVSKNIKFRIRAAAANGNNIYLDNFKFNATSPAEIQVTQSSIDVLDGGYYNFPTTTVGGTSISTFTINNTGTSNLTLTGPIAVTGSGFSMQTTFGTTTVAAGGSTTFQLAFTPTANGSFTGNVSFGTNDCDEGTYNFQLNGIGQVLPPVADFTATPTVLCAGSTVSFTSTSSNAISYSWSFPGGTPSSSTVANPIITYNTAGSYNASLTVTNTAGSDTKLNTAYIIVNSNTGIALPISQGFNLSTFAPVNWTVNNIGGTGTWERTTAAGIAPTVGNAMKFNNYNNDDRPNEDEFIHSGANLIGYSTSTLTFDVAYAPYNTTTYDGLRVQVSSDCGATFTTVYEKSNTVLATAAATTSSFVPSTAQWRSESIDLTSFVGNQRVIVKFINLAGYGNQLYIDNINITGVAAPSSPVASFTSTATSLCAGQTVTYTNTSTNSPTSYAWSFPGGTPSTSTLANPVVTYAAAGNYNVSLVATNTGGSNTNTQTNLITVNAIPAAPTVSVVNNCGSSTLSATGSNLLWSTLATTPSITVTSGGTYTVTQTVGGCQSPNGSVTAAPSTVPAAPTVSVVNNCGSSTLSATGSNLLWSTMATTPSITVTSGGTYTVTQTVGGCQSANGSIAAAPLTVPSAPATAVSNNCGSSTLSATGSNLLWSTMATTPSITVTSGGTYTVTQTVGGCQSANGSIAAAPLTIPSAPATAVSNNCGSSTLSATGSNLLWSTMATTPSITVTSGGTYTVTQTVGGCQSANGSIAAAPLTIPSAPATAVSNNCGSSTLSATGSNLLWSTMATTPSITVTSGGTYTVTQTVGGCQSPNGIATATPSTVPATPTVSVVNNCGSSTLSATGSNLLWSTMATTPSITVTSGGTYTVTQTIGGCQSLNGSVTAAPLIVPVAPTVSVTNNCGSSTLIATGSNLLWSTTETSPSISVSNSGIFTVTQTIGGCQSANGSVTAAPLDLPVVTQSALPAVCRQDSPFTLTGGTPAGGSYSGNQVVSNVFSPGAAGVGTTVITYTFFDGNNCSATATTSIEVNDCNSIQENGIAIGLSPNPTSGELSISSSNSIIEFSLFDSSGKLVLSSNDVNSENVKLDLSKFADGVYNLVINTENESVTKRLILKK